MDALAQIKKYYQRLNPDIPQDAWNAFEHLLEVKTLEKGEFITVPGDISNEVCFVAEGLMALYVNMEDRKMVLEFFEENTYCCDYESFLTRKPSRLYMEAMEKTTLVNLKFDDLQYVYSLGASFERMGRLIAEYLYICISHKSSSLLTESPEQRYQELMQTRPYLFQRLPLYLIASYLGITPESLSRIRKRMLVKAGN